MRKAAYDVIGLQVALLEAADSLRNSPLEPLISNALRLAAVSGSRIHAVARSITLEDRASSQEKRAWPAPNPPWELGPADISNIARFATEAANLLSITGLS